MKTKEKKYKSEQWMMRCLNHAPGLVVAWSSDSDECPLCKTYGANKRLQARIGKLKEKIKKLKKDLPKKKKKRKKKNDLAF
jgi:hypothetical protein